MAQRGTQHVTWRGVTSHSVAWHRQACAVPRRGTTPRGTMSHRPGTAAGTDRAIAAAKAEHHVPATWPEPPWGPGHPAATGPAESKILRPSHVAPWSHSFPAVCRCPPGCPALPPAPPPESVAGSIAAGTATASLAPAAIWGHSGWGRCHHEAARAGLPRRG